MRLEQLEYFVALKKYGSMSIASEKLFVTQQTLSIAIKKFEMELGGQLFTRTSKGVILNELGEKVYDKAVKLLFLKEDIIQMGAENQHTTSPYPLTGSIKLVATVATLQNLLMSSIKYIYKRNPKLNIICESLSHSQIMPQMNLDAYDIGFMNISQDYLQQHKEQLFGSEYQVEIITAGKITLLVGSQSDLIRQKSVSIKRVVRDYTLACGNGDQLAFLNINPIIEANKIVPNILQCPNLDIIYDNVRNNNCISFSSCSAWHLMHCDCKDEIIILPLKETIPVVTLVIIPKNRPLSEEASVFLEIVKEFVQTAD